MAANTPGLVDQSVADFTWGLMLAAARRVVESDAWLRTGAWKGWAYDQFIGADIHGTTLGIIGMGRIGQAVARRAAGFDMTVLYHNRSRLPADDRDGCARRAMSTSKDALLKAADHVVLALPYTPQAQHLIGARELRLMKPTATLINIARGGIVDDAALAAALKARTIAAAALDVFEGEPAVHPGSDRLAECRACARISPAPAFRRGGRWPISPSTICWRVWGSGRTPAGRRTCSIPMRSKDGHKSPMRLKAEIWVMAYVRRVNGAGAMAMVLKKGDADAGAIYIKVSHETGGGWREDRKAALYGPAPSGIDEANQDRRWVCLHPATPWRAPSMRPWSGNANSMRISGSSRSRIAKAGIFSMTG